MKRIDQLDGTFDRGRDKHSAAPSEATVRRLPRYFRHLERLLAEDTLRISSSALAARMGITASQIRQDLACFGDFGQQGYGYNVRYLHTKIARILGVSTGHRAVFLGLGDITRALLSSPAFARGDIRPVAVFADEGTGDSSLPLYSMSELPVILPTLGATIAVLTTPTAEADATLRILSDAGVHGVLNYTTTPMTAPDMVIQNVYLDDPCLLLSYRIEAMKENED